MDTEDIKKILIVRIDNIGDLVCTTPAIRALRKRFPLARLGMLVNSYNADAIFENSDLDEIFVYEKSKHSEKGVCATWFSNMKLFRKIRKKNFDIAICFGSHSPRLARYTYLTGAKRRIGYVPAGHTSYAYTDPVTESLEVRHEVVTSFQLLEPLGIAGMPPSLVVSPSPEERDKVLHYLQSQGTTRDIVAFHISSRKKSNRWPADKFIQLGNELIQTRGIRPLILWAPGSAGNRLHPGDDETAQRIAERMAAPPLLYKTTKLRELIAALSVARLVVCCDGGAMHIAAGLGKPLVTIWGTTDQKRWSPWNVEHVILQKGQCADEISVGEVVSAVEQLWKR